MNAVEQAVALLNDRRVEALAEVARLQREVAELDAALGSLARLVARPVDAHTQLDPIKEEIRSGLQNAWDSVRAEMAMEPWVETQSPTVTGAVRTLMEQEYGPWTPSRVREMLANTSVKGDRDWKTFSSAIRTAMHSLRVQGVAKAIDDQHTVAAKWLRDAEAPAATGASESEEPSDGSSRKEGGTGNEPAPPVVRGDDPTDPDVNHDHGNGASVVEALVP